MVSEGFVVGTMSIAAELEIQLWDYALYIDVIL